MAGHTRRGHVSHANRAGPTPPPGAGIMYCVYGKLAYNMAGLFPLPLDASPVSLSSNLQYSSFPAKLCKKGADMMWNCDEIAADCEEVVSCFFL